MDLLNILLSMDNWMCEMYMLSISMLKTHLIVTNYVYEIMEQCNRGNISKASRLMLPSGFLQLLSYQTLEPQMEKTM